MTDGSHLARRGDPEESHDAARYILSQLGELQVWVFERVCEAPGLTVSELSRLFVQRDVRRIGRRLNEIEKQGLVRRESGGSHCSVTGRPAARWFPMSEEEMIEARKKPPEPKLVQTDLFDEPNE